MTTPNIECPACGQIQSNDVLEKQELVTYWGDEGLVDVCCEECDVEFKVQEYVTRWWEVVEDAL